VQAGEAVTLSIPVTDASSGVTDVSGHVAAGDGPHDEYPRFTRVSGTARDGVWKAISIVPDAARTSTWTVDYIRAEDAAENSRSVSGAAIGTGSFNVTAASTPTPTPTTTAIPSATATSTPTRTPTPVGTPTATAPPIASRCSPRMPVQVSAVRAAPGRMNVTVQSGTRPGSTPNQLYLIRFDKLDNARVETSTGQVVSGAIMTLPTGATQGSFTIVRTGPADAGALVHLTVVDACGEWPTFVGGGRNAF
jgi:hypothetical protein